MVPGNLDAVPVPPVDWKPASGNSDSFPRGGVKPLNFRYPAHHGGLADRFGLLNPADCR